MDKQFTFPELCAHTHDLVNRYLNQLVDMNADHNATTQAALDERMSVFEFVSRMRLDFQPLFVTEKDVEKLWDEIREQTPVQEMVTTVTLKLLTHVSENFIQVVGERLRSSVETLVRHQGSLDADYHERIIEPSELEKLIQLNPWFAMILLITLGRDEYVKPDFQRTV